MAATPAQQKKENNVRAKFVDEYLRQGTEAIQQKLESGVEAVNRLFNPPKADRRPDAVAAILGTPDQVADLLSQLTAAESGSAGRQQVVQADRPDRTQVGVDVPGESWQLKAERFEEGALAAIDATTTQEMPALERRPIEFQTVEPMA